MNTSQLPALMPGLLGHQNSSRIILETLSELHYRGQPLGEARQVLEKWAQVLSNNEAPQQEVVLLEEGRELPFGDILGAMDQAQAQRFLVELIEDIVPHFSSQKSFVANLRRGHTQNGMKINLDGNAKFVVAMLGGLSDKELAEKIQTHLQSLTWVDDNLRQADTHVDVDVEIGELPAGNTRRLNF